MTHYEILKYFIETDLKSYFIQKGLDGGAVLMALDALDDKCIKLSEFFIYDDYEYFAELDIYMANYKEEKENGYMSSRGS